MNNNKTLYSILAAVLLMVVVAAGAYMFLKQQDDNSQQDTVDTTTKPTDSSDTTTEDESDGLPKEVTSFTSEKGVAVSMSSPTRGAKVSSPLQVSGSVPGSWSHEGQFTVRLLDSNSNILAEAPATLSGGWMTENMVEFAGTLSFEPQAEGSGLLVLVKANPSDTEENSDSVTIPITF